LNAGMAARDARLAWPEALRAGIRLGQRLFDITIEVIFEQNTQWPAVAMYDRWTDRVKIFVNHISEMVAQGADPRKLVMQAVAHEFGHAREARLFAKSGVCPWYLCVATNCRLETEEGFYHGKDFRPEFAQLTSWIQDFPIDRKLSEYGIRDQTAKARIVRIQQILQERRPTEPAGKLRLQTILMLPSEIRHYMFGDICHQDRIRIQQFAASVLGAKEWEEAVELISSREFGDIPKYETVTTAYFRDFLRLGATFESVAREQLGDLPAFWTNDAYRALHIH
jgi:hypothetical protein